MRKSRFTETQVIAAEKEAEGGVKVANLSRQHGISAQAIYTGGSSIPRSKLSVSWSPETHTAIGAGPAADEEVPTQPDPATGKRN